MSEYSVASNSGTASWMNKRYAGVPAVYLAAGAVLILVYVAYRVTKNPLKNTTGAPATSAANVTPVDPYQGLASNGTVTTSQPVYYVSPNTQNVDTGAGQTMAQWEKSAVDYLVTTGVPIATAQGAIMAYVNGLDMTYEQSDLVNKAVAKVGTPPTLSSVGAVAPRNIDWTDPNNYVSYQRVADTGSISGIMADGTIHHFTLPEWQKIVDTGDYARKPYVSL